MIETVVIIVLVLAIVAIGVGMAIEECDVRLTGRQQFALNVALWVFGWPVLLICAAAVTVGLAIKEALDE